MLSRAFLLSIRSADPLRKTSTGPTSSCRFRVHRLAHTVRVILTDDLPNGKAYKGEVLSIRAGYARNHLIPGKIALYATPENFARMDMEDPDLETSEEKTARLQRETMSDEGAEEVKAADFLRHYLRNKVLTIWRKVDPGTQAVYPGMVDAKAVREKLSKHLKIDLENHEKIHLQDELIEPDELTEDKLQERVDAMDVEKPCDVQIRRLGTFVARITLAGGYAVPLRVAVKKTAG